MPSVALPARMIAIPVVQSAGSLMCRPSAINNHAIPAMANRLARTGLHISAPNLLRAFNTSPSRV